jgi:mediator of RNA polymerase II transcription subunit 12
MAALRATLLGRAGFSVDEEEEERNVCIALMNQSLPAMRANVDTDVDMDLGACHNLGELAAELSRSTKSEIGLWLRQKVGLQVVQPTISLHEWDGPAPKGGTSAITASDFNTVRQYLETVEDYSMLADVLKIVTSSNDADVLASCADTLNLNLDTFAAIGALKGLFDILIGRLRSWGDDVDFIPRVFLVSMSDLAARIPEQNILARQLAQELARSDRKTAADACSPVSDHMALVEAEEAHFADEIEKVLASGNSMDQSTLMRLFQRISLRMEESWAKSPEQHRSCGLLFTRLRTFDAPQFDLLMVGWVNRFMQMPDRPSMEYVLGPLVSFGCLNLNDVAVISGTLLDKLDADDPAKVDIARDLLSLVVAPSNGPRLMTTEEAYRLCIKRGQLQSDNPAEIVTAIRRALENRDFKCGSALFPALGLTDPLALYRLLQRFVLLDADLVSNTFVVPLIANSSERVRNWAVAIIDRLVAAERYKEEATSMTIEEVLNLADDLTLPFCQLKIASMFALNANTQDSEEEAAERLQALDVAIETAVAVGKMSWTCIVPFLEPSIAQHIRQRAEAQFLASFPSPKALNTEDNMQSRIQRAENLFYISQVSLSSTSSSTANMIATELVSTLNNIWHLLSNVQIPEIKGYIVTKWIPLLLSFITLQASVFEASKLGHETRANVILSLAALLLELQAQETSRESVTTLIEQTYDLALYLVDCLPDDVRQQCIRSLRDTVSNPRISYLFSIAANPSDRLILSQKEKGPPVAPGLTGSEARAMVGTEKEKMTAFPLRRWEMLGEPTPNVGENDTSLSLTLFGARRG